MTENFQFEKIKFERRSLLKGAVMVCGGAALSAAVPSFALTGAGATAEFVSEESLHPITVSASQNIGGPVTASTGIAPRFSKEFLANKVFQDLALNFDPPGKIFIDPKLLETGALVQPSGDILFRVFAPNANDVRLKFDLIRIADLTLAKRDGGVFESVLPYDENRTGPVTVNVYIDGMINLYPFMPIHWSASCPRNFIEIPDTDMEFMHIKDVPHGAMSREIYWADVLQSWERCMVYTPPGYMKSSKEYPVLYLQHGGGENEVVWDYCGRVAHILDNLIAEGKAEPFMVVMNNDMLRYSDTAAGVIDLAFERMLMENCIPYIEKNYRVKTGKWNRAIAGTSMGCMMSCDIAFRHPEVFGNLGTLNASMTHDAESFRTTYVRPYSAVMKAPEEFAKNYKVYFRSAMPQEDHLPYFLADDKICANAGIDKLPSYHRIIYPQRQSKWNGWRMGLRDFSQLLFRAT
jgi:enterochelin esterase family protein